MFNRHFSIPKYCIILIWILKEGGEIIMKECQKGFTLLEVLISIILLFIVLTSFMGFFTQSAMFNKKNEQKLGTLQMAQKYINLIEDKVSLSDVSSIPRNTQLDKNIVDQLILKNPSQTVDCPYNVKGFITNNTPRNLTQFKVIIEDKQDPKNNSSTYTYIRK